MPEVEGGGGGVEGERTRRGRGEVEGGGGDLAAPV